MDYNNGPFVIIESPFSSSNGHSVEENIKYARRAVSDSIRRGETPFASHLIYTQEGILDDTVPHEREMGIQTGFRLYRKGIVEKCIVYADMGISEGMLMGIGQALKAGVFIIARSFKPTTEGAQHAVRVAIAEAKRKGYDK